MESFCNHVDSSGTGTIRKAHFAKILKNIGFPFSWIDLNEVLLRYSNAPKFDIIDYQTFLNDAGVTSKSEKLQLDLNLDVKSTQQTGWRTYTRVLLDVKRMLLDSMLNTGKQKDDIYGMFAVWDRTNTGAVTATQFLRVLVQLQVDLRDHDQDFLVDLLDTTSMGRIDYDNS
jgi:Ca2+-binding EF-hand superfamily protein